jgi:hypothetical protein
LDKKKPGVVWGSGPAYYQVFFMDIRPGFNGKKRRSSKAFAYEFPENKTGIAVR